jgi:predicted phage tail protein
MQLVEVKLLGELGRRFGRFHSFMATSPRDVISALSNQMEGFKEYLIHAHEHGIGFRLVDNKSEGMNYEEACFPCDRLIIAPIISGSKSGIGAILAGVALVALAFVSFGGSVAGGALFAGFAAGKGFALGSGILFSLGLSLVTSGIAALLTPPIKTPKSDRREDSFLFDGATETTTQGFPVPLLYGRFLVESPLIVSSSITTVEVPT